MTANAFVISQTLHGGVYSSISALPPELEPRSSAGALLYSPGYTEPVLKKHSECPFQKRHSV